MLVELSIRDFALIETAEVALGNGLNCLTGETGAGKSLFVGALELLLGEAPRGGAGAWVRKDAEEARVEGRFAIGEGSLASSILEVLAAEAPEIAEEIARARTPRTPRTISESELVLGRTLTQDGRTRAHVNHRPVALRVLKALAPLLVQIHGQNDHQRLFQPAEQMRLIDSHGGLEDRVGRYTETRQRALELVARRDRSVAERSARKDRLEFLRFQHAEIEGACVTAGEQAVLSAERVLLRNSDELARDLGRLVEALVEGDDALLPRLRSAVRTLERWQPALARLGEALEDARSAEIHVEEACGAIGSLLGSIHADPARLEAIEERLAELERLERKHGTDELGLLARRAEVAAEIAHLEAEAENLDGLGAEIARAARDLEELCADLAQRRRALGPRLERSVLATLQRLGLEKARFTLDFKPFDGAGAEELARFGPRGGEEAEFLLAANPGEDLAPLARVASGGEAARILLAIRTVLAGAEGGRTLVFDEVDSGVGGRLGPEVGAHLKELGLHHQVLCVTHLAAIAALADRHLCATKEIRAGRTRTIFVPLEGEARVAEIADMIAGGADEATARAEARRLLEPEIALPPNRSEQASAPEATPGEKSRTRR